MFHLQSPVAELPKITKPQLAALKKLKIHRIQDLLLYFPYRYLDFSKLVKIKDIRAGENITLRAKIKSIAGRFSFRGRLSLAEAVVSDDTGSLKIVWFNQAYLAKSLSAGEEIFLAGSPDYYKGVLQLTNPIHEKPADLSRLGEAKAGFPIHTGRLVPVYHLTQKLYPKTLRNLIAAVLPLAKDLTETLPAEVLRRQNLFSIQTTAELAHFPQNFSDAENAKKRLAFEEIFINQLSAQQYKLKLKQKQSYAIKFDQALIKQFVSSLDFQLTADQKKSAWEILQDLEKHTPMNRLLEGDVGSGKTLVALLAALQAVSFGCQAVLLTPTEILAKQHFETSKKYLLNPPLNFNVRCALLTNSYSELNNKTIKKGTLLREIKEGMPGLFVGTHALLYDKVKFAKLALVIIDEQHRFGVQQRAALMKTRQKIPHLLSLTATPIPRTLQLAFYNELEISQIKTKPSGRKAIITRLVNSQDREQAYNFVKQQLLSGRQAFVIAPLIESSEKLEIKSVKQEWENLKKIFPQCDIGLLHGKMTGKEKETAMENFLAGRLQILVATSVVEVGVDVPNASVMLIEGAERFGLSQLHQFRGRVGRAEHQSYCLVFSDKQDEETIKKRLEAFCQTQDGFILAELDLKLRGFGEIYGQQQSGWNFKYFDPNYSSLVLPARQEAAKLLSDDITLNAYPLLKAKIQDKVIHFE